jgi:DNA topoisomerase III
VTREGKNLVPTEMGIGLIETLPEKSLASPELTGTWEARLARVTRGEETRAGFMAGISRYVSEVVSAIRGGPGAAQAFEAPPARRPAAGPKPAAAGALTCPRCKQGTLVAGKRGWGCTRWREGCGFVIWFEIAGRRITDAELADLISKGKTRKRTWRSTDGAEIGGRLVLDLSATRDAGAARLETAGA